MLGTYTHFIQQKSKSAFPKSQEEERRVEEESYSYADSVALTLSQEERTAKARESLKTCASGEELFDIVNNLILGLQIVHYVE